MSNSTAKPILLIALVVGLFVVASHMNHRKPYSFGEEYELIDQIRSASSTADRERLVSELDNLPVRIYPFYSRWMLINDAQPFHCWTDDGYDPSLSDMPRDIQLLAATSYGKSDNDNGGFDQFFTNGTGVFAPKMIEWFARSGLTETTSVLRDAIAVFGDDFPRSQAARNDFLARFDGASRAEWDPFYEMDDRFYASLPYEEKVFDVAADRWLRKVCGIESLHDTLNGTTTR